MLVIFDFLVLLINVSNQGLNFFNSGYFIGHISFVLRGEFLTLTIQQYEHGVRMLLFNNSHFVEHAQISEYNGELVFLFADAIVEIDCVMVLLDQDVVFSFEVRQFMLLVVINVQNYESSIKSLFNPLSIALHIASAFDIDVGVQI